MGLLMQASMMHKTEMQVATLLMSRKNLPFIPIMVFAINRFISVVPSVPDF